MPNHDLPSAPSRWQVMTAFAAVYLIWGSTYLGIRVAIETVPPFLMLAVRFIVAGVLLYGWARLRGAPPPALFHWRSAAIVGGLLLVGGNGGVAWSEQVMPSSLAALLIAMVPLWMVLLEWLRRGGVRPGAGVIAGLALGFAGVVLLVSPGKLPGGSHVNPVGALVLILASLSWAIGSLYSRGARLPASPLLATAMEMLAAGTLLLVLGFVTREPARLALSSVSLRSFLALGYLALFGSIVAFTAYIWLLRVSTPARVSTYAYINPVVAIFLGWALAGEALTARTLLAAAIVITAVAIITTRRAHGSPWDRRGVRVHVETDEEAQLVAAPALMMKASESGPPQ